MGQGQPEKVALRSGPEASALLLIKGLPRIEGKSFREAVSHCIICIFTFPLKFRDLECLTKQRLDLVNIPLFFFFERLDVSLNINLCHFVITL